MNQCTYCKKEFTTKVILNSHMKTANYCLKIQGNLENRVKYKCDICSGEFSSKYILNRHIVSFCSGNNPIIVSVKNKCESQIEEMNLKCESKLDDLRFEYDIKLDEMNLKCESKLDDLRFEYDIKLDEKDNEVQRFKCEMSILRDKYLVQEKAADINEAHAKHNQDLIDRMVEKPTNTNNNTTNNNHVTINNVVSLSNEDIKVGILDKFNTNTLIGGPKEFAQICVDYVTDDDGEMMYQCTDTNRGTFWHKIEDGSVVKDVGAIELVRSVRDAGLKVVVNKSASELIERGLELEEVNTYRRKFDEDGKYSREFNGQFRKHFAAGTSVDYYK
jgi:hypothetical protein